MRLEQKINTAYKTQTMIDKLEMIWTVTNWYWIENIKMRNLWKLNW